MGFPRRLLADHEKMVLDLKPHWVAVVPAIAQALLILVAWFFAHKFAGDQLDEPGTVQLIIAAIAFLLLIWRTVSPIVKWATTHFVLTSDRLITRSGVIAKQSKEIPLERINDVAFTQSILDRMLGAGDLLIESAGERGQNKITNVRKPEHVQLTIYKEVEQNNTRMMQPGGPAPAPAGDSVTDQLQALARLKDQGVISDMEFETKKQELLKRL